MASEAPPTFEHKISVVGASEAGKTALATRYLHQFFAIDYEPSNKSGDRKLAQIDGRRCVIDIHELSRWGFKVGKEGMACPEINACIFSTQGHVLVYSVASRQTFELLHAFHDLIVKKHEQGEKPVIAVVGTKCDLESEREVPTSEGKSLAQEWGALFFETSAKTPTNVDEAFTDVVREMNKVVEAWTRDRERKSKSCSIQ